MNVDNPNLSIRDIMGMTRSSFFYKKDAEGDYWSRKHTKPPLSETFGTGLQTGMEFKSDFL